MSFSENSRKSLISYLRFVIRSIPIPKANPLYFLLSMPQFSNTLGSTIPHPKISTQPLPLHKVQPAPLQMEQEISISADGSVNGKYEGLKRTLVPSPYSSCTKKNRVCFRSAKDTSSSTYNPSTWWKKQCARAEIASFRYTLPGMIALNGGFPISIIRT